MLCRIARGPSVDVSISVNAMVEFADKMAEVRFSVFMVTRNSIFCKILLVISDRLKNMI